MKNEIIEVDKNVSGVVIFSKKYGKVVTVIDSEDIPRIRAFRWCVRGDGNNLVVQSSVMGFYMHRLIMSFPVGGVIDHADGNTLNNTKANLRIATHSQNAMNRSLAINNKLGVKGVSLYRGKYRTQIFVKGTPVFIGDFESIEEASLCYMLASVEYFGEFARPI